MYLVVCGSICDCDDFDLIADWGEAHLDFLRRFMPCYHGVPSGRWLNIMINRTGPALFREAFTAWVRETWPERPDLIAIDGKTSRRSHDHAEALVSIDAIATNPAIAQAIRDTGADYLLAVKANQATIRQEIEDYFADAPPDRLASHHEADKGHGRIEERTSFPRRIPPAGGGLRAPRQGLYPSQGPLPHQHPLLFSSRRSPPQDAARAVRGHWAIENSPHWTLDTVFHDDLRRNRKGHGAINMAIVRHFAFNLVRTLDDNRSLKNRRKRAGWDTKHLTAILGTLPC